MVNCILFIDERPVSEDDDIQQQNAAQLLQATCAWDDFEAPSRCAANTKPIQLAWALVGMHLGQEPCTLILSR